MRTGLIIVERGLDFLGISIAAEYTATSHK